MHVTSKSGRVFRIPTDAEDARICAGIAADPDAAELSDAQLNTLRPRAPVQPKAAVAVPLSPEVVAFFKAGGPDWQTRLDAVLQDYVRTHS